MKYADLNRSFSSGTETFLWRLLYVQKMHGTLLRASATYCIGFAERTLRYSELNPLSKGSFWVKDLAMRRYEQFICEMKRTKREERNKFGKTKGNGEVQDLAVLKRAA